jgi:hypothetical protein
MSGKFFFSTVSLELYCSAAILWDQLCICGRNAVRFRAVVASGASWRAFLVTSSAAAPSSLGVGHDEAPRGNTPPWKPHGVSSFNWLSDGGSPRITRPAYEPGGPQPSSNSQYPASGSRWLESESRTSPTLFQCSVQCSVQVRFRKGRVSPEPDFLAATVRSLWRKLLPFAGKICKLLLRICRPQQPKDRVREGPDCYQSANFP